MSTAFERSQFNYDNALPPDDSAREMWVEQRTEELAKDWWQDLEYLSDAVSDAAIKIGWYRKDMKCGPNHPLAVTFLTLLRDGSDDIELARMLRASAKDYITNAANDLACEEAS
jgi:hypothetical protein